MLCSPFSLQSLSENKFALLVISCTYFYIVVLITKYRLRWPFVVGQAGSIIGICYTLNI